VRQLIYFLTLTGFLGLSIGCGGKQPASAPSPFRDRLDAAVAIQNSFEKDNALVAVAKEAAAGGDTGVANDALDKIANSFTKDNTAAECALKLAKAGKGAEATKVAQKISNSFTRDATLAKLAKGATGD
jgi:hypothetical protein